MKNVQVFPVETLTNTVKMPARVTSRLMELIRDGTYPVKSRLPSETEMAKQFGVSRTVIREALARLKSEGMIESRQGSGVFVREASMDTPFRIDPNVVDSLRSVLEVLELRLGLESEMAALAAERCTAEQLTEIRICLNTIDKDVRNGADGVDADMQFHRSIARATNNPHYLALWDFISQYLKSSMIITRKLESCQEEMTRQVLAEHEAMVVAIAARNPEAARTAARHHMKMAAHRLSTVDPGNLAQE